MKAWVYEDYGCVNVLKFDSNVAVPDVEARVLIKVVSAALNQVDAKRRHGKFKATHYPLPNVPACDVAGVGLKAGCQVRTLKWEMKYMGNINEKARESPKQFGSLAEYTTVEEKLLAPKPKNLDFVRATGLPLVIETAYEGLERTGFSSGKSILVLNGAGGVGSLIIQVFTLQQMRHF
ncbi:2-methylene-furan-3-one reductase-like [Quillaja saponaria]|uniref:2-methylene-furan-3-one reductase-like n=1 Tax=Quillaja saponaria TaxID=32244 RepID=A0AAD7L8V8_QUISA|nr:2-methylene-furan-3-one reductase-like [Quillaja saponaria]